MKTLLITLFVFCSITLYSQTHDTTFTAKLSSDWTQNKISMKCKIIKVDYTENGETGKQDAFLYELAIDNKSITDTILWSEDYCQITLIDINKTDNSKEILITGPGMEDESCYRVYRNSDGPKLMCKADYYGSFEPDGKGTVKAGRWTGFCSIYDKFTLSDNGDKLEMKTFDFYPVEMDYYYVNPTTGDYESQKYGKVVNSFELLLERNSTSKVVAKTKPGDKITITGIDLKAVKTIEKDAYNEDNEISWIWVQMKTEDGTTGWILMKQWDQEFWSKLIEGVMFAA